MSDEKVLTWFACRSIFQVHAGIDQEPSGYEERITLWHVSEEREAIDCAWVEAGQYAADLSVKFLEIIQCSQSDEPTSGSEIFSLVRYSGLTPPAYVNEKFSTGQERQRLYGE